MRTRAFTVFVPVLVLCAAATAGAQQPPAAGATTGTPTYRRFRELAATNPELDARHKLYQFRVVEELYDVEQDPDCLKNLIAESNHAAARDKLRADLDAWMIKTGDPMLEVFRRRDDAAYREAYVAAQERETGLPNVIVPPSRRPQS